MENCIRCFNPVFIGHGSPMNALADNAFARFLAEYAKKIGKPAAVVVISAHWQTRGTFITGNDNPAQIYDFYGFPEALYNVGYTPPGSAAVAALLSQEIEAIQVDPGRGIDHAGWAVMKHMYPEQDVPLLELSLDTQKSKEAHFMLGLELGKLRRQGILFVGSGNMVHNLRDLDFASEARPFPWAVEADRWLQEKLGNREFTELIQYEKYFPEYRRSIPTEEHYLPLLYILGMHTPGKEITCIYEEIQNGSISMRSIEVS